MKTLSGFIFLCFGIVAYADNHTAEAYELAQSCFSIQSQETGKYLTKVTKATTRSYEFVNSNAGGKARFFFKPTQLGSYLLADREGQFLGSKDGISLSALDDPGIVTEWRVLSEGHTYQLRNLQSQELLQFWYTETRKWWLFTWKVHKKEERFRLVAQDDCFNFPEVSLNAWPKGEPESAEDQVKLTEHLKGDISKPVRGFMDAHSHMMSYEFLGGKALPGDPFHRYGVTYALDSCEKEHGANGVLDIIGGDAKAHNTDGWPSFTDWPAYDAKGHSGYYYRWVERAHFAGLRMMVVYLVENQVLCNIQKNINPVSWAGGNNSCNTMDSLFLQITRMHELVDYVDAQYGGPGKGFMRIVSSPDEARAAIADGKLALVLGVEASEVLDCGELDFCDQSVVDVNLDRLYQAGVRVMYPVHKFDNHFGGSSLQNGLVHLGQKLSTGHYFRTEDCDANPSFYDNDYVRGLLMESGIPGVPTINQAVIQSLVDYLGPKYPADKEQCNRLGLTGLGAYLVNRMIDKKMIIDLDHLSPKAAATVMDIVQARQYSGVVSTHGWMLRGKDEPGHAHYEDSRLHTTFERLLDTGGFVSPINKDSDKLIVDIEEYLLARMSSTYPGLSESQLRDLLLQMNSEDVPGVGIGVDMGGLATMANPKGKNPGYPFATEFGNEFDRQGEISGRQFDLADDGVAHYGMLADHIAQVREDAGIAGKGYVYDSLMNSTEAYLQMWRRAELRQETNHYLP